MIKKLFTSIYARYATLLVLALLSANYALGEPKTVKYMQNSTTAASIPTDGGTAPAGSSIEFKNTYGTKEQLTKNNSMTYTLKGYEGCIIKSLSMSMHSNKSAGTGKFSLVAGSTTLAEIASNTGFNQAAWYGAWSQAYVNVVPTMIKNDYVIQSGENVVLTISASASSLFCQSITITYEEVSTSVATPTITPSETDFLGSASVEISCATEGASIYYTLDETDPTNASTQYTGAINISETTTIKAIAYNGDEKSSIATKTYTKIVPLATMDEIFNASATTGNYWITFNNWIVSGVKGSNAYFTDNSGKGLILYKNSHGFESGDILNGTVKCALTRYKGSAEITDLTSSTEGLTVTKDGNLNTVETTISDLSGVNTGAYINIGALTYDGTYFADGTNTIKPYNTFMTLPTLTNGKKYYVKGVYIQFDDTKEIAPLTAEDFTEVPATTYDITINPSLNGFVTVDAVGNEAQEGQIVTLTITPDTHYALSDISVTDASSNPVVLTDQKFTMPASAVTISATFALKEQHYVMYSSLGEEIGSGEDVYDGECLANVPSPEFDGLEFVGWTQDDAYVSSATKPELFDTESPITEDLILYAVFKKTEGVAPVDFNLDTTSGDFIISYGGNYASTDIGSSSNGKISTSTDIADARVYTFTKISDGVYSIYDKTKEQYVGYKSSTDLQYSTSSYNWNITASDKEDGCWRLASETSGRAFVYRTSNLFGGYSTGNITSEGEYHDVIITGVSSSTTIYTITKPQNQNVTIASSGWSSFSSDYAVDFSEAGLKAYVVTNVAGTKVTYKEVTKVPALTGVVLNGTPSTNYSIPVVASAELTGTNLLHPGMGETVVAEDGYYCYGLSNGAWKQLSSEGAVVKGKAYLMTTVAPPTENGGKFEIVFEGEPTGIKDVQGSKFNVQGAAYNLNGIRVNENYKGLVIMNGKKYLNK